MQEDYADSVLRELDDVVARFRELQARGVSREIGAEADAVAAEFVTRALQVARRATGGAGEHVRQIEMIIAEVGWSKILRAIPHVGGTIEGLRHAVASGYLVRVVQLARAEVFSDFLEMAQYLLDEGYKDAAAVLVRGVLEGHLRELCTRNRIDTTCSDTRGMTVPKKVDTMNADLKKAGAYSTTQQKSVTAWYGLGTDAAHGNYGEYTTEEVKLTLQGVRDFLARHPG
jgi:hypothetical protein